MSASVWKTLCLAIRRRLSVIAHYYPVTIIILLRIAQRNLQYIT